jgi:hypothetical protein
MSIEIHVLSDQQLQSIAAWQEAIDIEGFKLKLDPTVQLETASGFLPALLHNKKSGFESYHDDARELMETYAHLPTLDFGHRWKYALSFRWGSLAHEGVAVFMAATAYAQATGGAVFDPQEGKMLALDECREIARKWEKEEFRL